MTKDECDKRIKYYENLIDIKIIMDNFYGSKEYELICKKIKTLADFKRLNLTDKTIHEEVNEQINNGNITYNKNLKCFTLNS